MWIMQTRYTPAQMWTCFGFKGSRYQLRSSRDKYNARQNYHQKHCNEPLTLSRLLHRFQLLWTSHTRTCVLIRLRANVSTWRHFNVTWSSSSPRKTSPKSAPRALGFRDTRLDCEASRLLAPLPNPPHLKIGCLDVVSETVDVEQRIRQPVRDQSVAVSFEK